MKKPRIPLSPSLLPQQRIVSLSDLAERPQPFDSVVGWDERPPGVKYPKGPSKPDYLGQVEWSWSPMHESVISFYIHKGRQHWVLWQYRYDDNWEQWEWTPVGYVPRSQASKKQAAVHLLVDFWRFYRAKTNIEHYHWINESGEISTSEWRTIGLLVWPEVASKPTNHDPEADER